MNEIATLKPTDRILIYTPRTSFPGGRAYLCADGSTSSNRADAQEHWGMQFDAVVAENWIVQPAQFELVNH